MVDRSVLANGIAEIRDAVTRVREVLPGSAEKFSEDRSAREIVALNLFVALEQVFSLAAHWLADEGRAVPARHREVFQTLAERSVLPPDLAARLGKAIGLRNLIAHRHGAPDRMRVHAIASSDLEDLLDFCAQLARAAERGA